MDDKSKAQYLMAQAASAAAEGQFRAAGEALQQAFAIDSALAGGHRKYLAAALNAGVDLRNIMQLGPPRLNTLATCGWLNSFLNAKPVNARGEAIPWFVYPAIDFLEPKIKPQWEVLEWGCGNSTLWWSKRARSVLSIEHDPEWRDAMAAQAPPNARIVLARSEEAYVNMDREGNSGLFDAIVIDGEWRNECARKAVTLAKPSGIIVFDNSDRKMARDGLIFLTEAGWKRIDFFGILPAYLYRTCTSIFYRSDEFMKRGVLPCDLQSSLGPTCAQVLRE